MAVAKLWASQKKAADRRSEIDELRARRSVLHPKVHTESRLQLLSCNQPSCGPHRRRLLISALRSMSCALAGLFCACQSDLFKQPGSACLTMIAACSCCCSEQASLSQLLFRGAAALSQHCRSSVLMYWS